MIEGGHLLLNGKTAAAEARLQINDRLQYIPPAQDEPPVNLQYSVIYEDQDLLVVNKPGNLPVHPAGCFFNHTLWALLKHDRPDLKLHFINRLDRETSGIVAVAKTPEVHGWYSNCENSRKTKKRYTALVEGSFPDSLTAEGVMLRRTDSAIRKKQQFIPSTDSRFHVVKNIPRARLVKTDIRKIDEVNNISILETSLESGRIHQVRATLEALGYPLVGDKMYGVDETIFLRFISGRLTEQDRRLLRMERQALHASTMILPQPCKSAMLNLHTPAPPDFLDFYSKQEIARDIPNIWVNHN